MAHEHRYEIKLTWTGAARGPTQDYKSYSREYRIEAPGKPTLAASADPAFRGDAALYNPEDLLVASLSGCHMLTYLAYCTFQGIAVVAYEDQASGTMVQEGNGGRFAEVILRHAGLAYASATPAQRAMKAGRLSITRHRPSAWRRPVASFPPRVLQV